VLWRSKVKGYSVASLMNRWCDVFSQRGKKNKIKKDGVVILCADLPSISQPQAALLNLYDRMLK
jgi:hypothetical protein